MSKNYMERILKDLNIPHYLPEDMKIEKVKILNCVSIKDDGFSDLVGKSFIVSYKFENQVGIEYDKNIIWFKTGEYEFVEVI